MVHYRKLWNFDLQRKKDIVDYHIYETLIYNGKMYGNIPKQLKILNIYRVLELSFTIEKLWYYGKNCGTVVNYS